MDQQIISLKNNNPDTILTKQCATFSTKHPSYKTSMEPPHLDQSGHMMGRLRELNRTVHVTTPQHCLSFTGFSSCPTFHGMEPTKGWLIYLLLTTKFTVYVIVDPTDSILFRYDFTQVFGVIQYKKFQKMKCACNSEKLSFDTTHHWCQMEGFLIFSDGSFPGMDSVDQGWWIGLFSVLRETNLESSSFLVTQPPLHFKCHVHKNQFLKHTHHTHINFQINTTHWKKRCNFRMKKKLWHTFLLSKNNTKSWT